MDVGATGIGKFAAPRIELVRSDQGHAQEGSGVVERTCFERGGSGSLEIIESRFQVAGGLPMVGEQWVLGSIGAGILDLRRHLLVKPPTHRKGQLFVCRLLDHGVTKGEPGLGRPDQVASRQVVQLLGDEALVETQRMDRSEEVGVEAASQHARHLDSGLLDSAQPT